MIRPIDIKLNAAHPELPLVEATTFTGSPSSVFIRGVPKAVGNWSITAVNVSVTYPDNSTTTRAAVESAEDVWVATIPGTATSGRTVAGFRILADGIDENGAAVTGYVLGFADFSVLSFFPVPAPGETFFYLRYFDTMPTTVKKMDVTTIDGILKYYNGTAWLPFTDLSNYYTKAETDNAIERVAAYYITYNAAGAAFPTRADLINATTYYSGGVVRVPTRNDYAVVLADETHDGAEWRYIYAVADGQTTGQWEAQYPVEGVIAYDNKVTPTSGNGVKSSGIWAAIWGALAALPTGFSSLYDWCVAQLAGKANDADVVHKTGNETIAGSKTFYGGIVMEDGADIDFSNAGRVIIRSSSDAVAILNHDGIDYSTDGGLNYQHYDWPSASGNIALAAGTGHNGNLAALDANGNPTDSGIAAGDLLTIVALTNSTETMASILARLNAINAAHEHVFFDCSGINVNPRLYLCTIMIDADANAVRVYDQVTGKLYIGPYDATETIGEVFAKAVDAYHSITVSAVTLDGVTVTGQTVTIREGTDATAPVYATATITDGAPVTFVVPKGMIYFLEITDALADHFGPRVTSGSRQGIATADAAVTFTYYDAEHIDVSEITTFAKLQEALTWFGTNETAARNNLVGIEIADTWTATNGTVYDNPRVVWDVHYFKDENGVSHLGALMGTKYCSHNDVQFDAAEGEECDSSTETVAEADVYYYGLAPGETSKTAANLTLLELSTGTALPYADYAKIYKSAIRDTTRNSLQYGYNNWRDSAYRQYLNSDAATGQWWGATHIGDIAPSQLNSVRGFMAGCSAALLAAAKKVKVATWPNSVTDGPNQITTLYETLDTFFLPSGSEVYGDVNRSGGASVEGELSPYWQARTGYTAPNNAATSTRIIYRELPVGSTASRSAANVRLRSAYRGSSGGVWFVGASGQVYYYGVAYYASASVPACVIY